MWPRKRRNGSVAGSAVNAADLIGMALHPLAGTVEKLRRSDAHLVLLYEQVGAYMQDATQMLVPNRDPNTGDGYFVYKVTKEPPLYLSTIIGDVLHNIRSSLDYLAHELIKLNGFPTGFMTQFPICATEKEFLNESINRNRLAGISLWAFQRIDAFQPHQMGIDNYAVHPLWRLLKLSNLDKHHALALAALSTKTRWRFVDRHTGAILGEYVNDTFMYDGDVIGHMPRAFIDQEAKIESKVTTQVSFCDAPVAGCEVLGVLQSLREFVGELMLPAFEPFFDPLPDALKLVSHGIPSAMRDGR
jgi:hypothetical protein